MLLAESGSFALRLGVGMLCLASVLWRLARLGAFWVSLIALLTGIRTQGAAWDYRSSVYPHEIWLREGIHGRPER